MTHSFQVRKTPGSDTASIRLVVCHRGRYYRRAIGVSVNLRYYNPSAKKINKRFLEAPVASAVGKIESRLLEVESPAMTGAQVLRAIEYALGSDVPVKAATRPRFWDYFREFADRDMPSKRFRQLAYRRISAVMGTRDDWEDIDGDWYFRFNDLMKRQGYSLNYISTLTNKLRAVLREGESRGFHTNTSYKDFPHRFETADTVYLTKEEIRRIWELELPSQEERKARDLFMLGYLTGSRYQNYSKLSMDNISGGKIRFIQPKTGGEVVIPCSPKVVEILGRWDGRAPKLAEANVNLKLKEVARKAGLTQKVEHRITKGGKTVITTSEKWQLVSTHTARRSGATNLYLEGVPIRVCRFLTGHKDDATFLKYIKVSREEGADLLANADFFK